MLKHPQITKCFQKSLNLLQHSLHFALQSCLSFCFFPSLLLLLFFFLFYRFSLRQPVDVRKDMNTVSSYLGNTCLTHQHLYFRSHISRLHCQDPADPVSQHMTFWNSQGFTLGQNNDRMEQIQPNSRTGHTCSSQQKTRESRVLRNNSVLGKIEVTCPLPLSSHLECAHVF